MKLHHRELKMGERVMSVNKKYVKFLGTEREDGRDVGLRS